MGVCYSIVDPDTKRKMDLGKGAWSQALAPRGERDMGPGNPLRAMTALDALVAIETAFEGALVTKSEVVRCATKLFGFLASCGPKRWLGDDFSDYGDQDPSEADYRTVCDRHIPDDSEPDSPDLAAMREAAEAAAMAEYRMLGYVEASL